MLVLVTAQLFVKMFQLSVWKTNCDFTKRRVKVNSMSTRTKLRVLQDIDYNSEEDEQEEKKARPKTKLGLVSNSNIVPVLTEQLAVARCTSFIRDIRGSGYNSSTPYIIARIALAMRKISIFACLRVDPRKDPLDPPLERLSPVQ